MLIVSSLNIEQKGVYILVMEVLCINALNYSLMVLVSLFSQRECMKF